MLAAETDVPTDLWAAKDALQQSNVTVVAMRERLKPPLPLAVPHYMTLPGQREL